VSLKVGYDPAVDVLTISLSPNRVQESDEVAVDVILDFDDFGRVVAIEVLRASFHVEDLLAFEFSTSVGGRL
jgi:uncharacterized protein YuzE